MLAAAVFCSSAIASEAPVYAGKPDCLVFNPHPKSDERVEWSGPCKNGYAEGMGAAQWYVKNKPAGRYEGPLVQGRAHGEGASQSSKGDTYHGGHNNGVRHGKGILTVANQYTLMGEFENGAISGPVEVGYNSGDRYTGGWFNGGPDGTGTMRFALGGKYEGGWKAGRLHGKGVITYPNNVTLEGEFRDGMLAGSAPPAETKDSYTLRDFDSLRPYQQVSTGAPVPYNKSYQDLTPEQQSRVRSWFTILQDNDVPPYPLKGTETITRAIAAGHNRVLEEGELRLDVLVDEEGKPVTAYIRATPDKALGDYAGKVLLLSKFTPARCGGKPCAMHYPFRFQLSTSAH